MSLFKQKRFLPYFATQFLGAFNDNIFKNALVIIFTYHIASTNQSIVVNLAAIVFILPYFLFSPLAGQVADKFEKSILIKRIKDLEIIIMLLGSVALYYQSMFGMFSVLFLMGTQSTFFGPVKYSILPQNLKKEELLAGNALVEAGTFLAILLGTILGSVLAAESEYFTKVSSAILVFAILGRVVCQQIPSIPAADANLKIDFNPLRSAKHIFSGLYFDQSNFLTAVGISWFWFFGVSFLTQFPNFSREVLGGSPYVATLLMAMFSIGIGVGSFLCSFMSGKRVELGIVPIGALGMTIAGVYVGSVDIVKTPELSSLWDVISQAANLKVMLGLLFLSISGGLFVVPLYAFLQVNTPQQRLSQSIAALNIMNAGFMVVAGIFAIVCFALGNSIQSYFVTIAIMNFLVALFIFMRVPEFIMRMGAWILVHSLYRIGKHDLHHIPKEGAAVLVANHVSFVDSIIIAAISDRPIRFVMYHKIYKLPVIHYLFKTMGAIPIASAKEDAGLLKVAYEQIANALEKGELVCIFPEGGLTPNGEIQPFKGGISKILQRTPVPVVPMALRGLWGTWFSRKAGRAMKGIPRNWMKKIDVMTGPLIAVEDVDLKTLESQVRTLKSDD